LEEEVGGLVEEVGGLVEEVWKRFRGGEEEGWKIFIT